MQLGGSAFTVRGQSINDSLEMMSMLASYGQIRERRGFPPLFSGAKHSPCLYAPWFAYLGNAGNHTIYVLKQAEPQIGQGSALATVRTITQGRYVIIWPMLPTPTLYKWAGKRLTPEVSKTVWFITLVVGGTEETGTKRAKYFKHLLQACARCRIPDKMCHLSVLEWNFLCP